MSIAGSIAETAWELQGLNLGSTEMVLVFETPAHMASFLSSWKREQNKRSPGIPFADLDRHATLDIYGMPVYLRLKGEAL